jgi:hypothetical protein
MRMSICFGKNAVTEVPSRKFCVVEIPGTLDSRGQLTVIAWQILGRGA